MEEFTVANEPVGALSEALGGCFAEGGFETRQSQDMAIVIVDGAYQLLDVASARDAADMMQSTGINVSSCRECPRATLQR
jgi:hypothetical protein